MKTLVLAADFSENAEIAQRWVREVALHAKARVFVVHAVDAHAMPSIPLVMQNAVARKLEELSLPLRRAGLDVRTAYELGRPWEVVARVGEREGADLIVVGACGQASYSKTVLGRTSNRIVRTSYVPVLTVHESDASRIPAFSSALVAVDFSEESAMATSSAVQLLHLGPPGAQLTLLHVCEVPMTYEAGTFIDMASRECAEQESESRAQLESLASPYRRLGFNVQTIVQTGYPAAVIEDVTRAIAADFLAVGTHGRSGIEHFMLGSVAERVLHHAPCPVLTVRQPAKTEPVHLSADAVGLQKRAPQGFK